MHEPQDRVEGQTPHWRGVVFGRAWIWQRWRRGTSRLFPMQVERVLHLLGEAWREKSVWQKVEKVYRRLERKNLGKPEVKFASVKPTT